MHTEVKMPDIGLDEVEVIEILVKLNEEVKIEQGLITVEGEKSSMEIPSPISGVVKKINVKIGDKVSTNTIIMIFTTDVVSFDNRKKENTDIPKKVSELNVDIKKNIVHATPSVRRLARDLNINLNNIIGSGRKNRILKDDIELYTKNTVNNLNELKIEKVKINVLQKTVGNNLYNNWINIPHVTQFDEVNITTLEDFRKKYNNEEHKKNINYTNVTILIFIIKAVSHALLKFPIFNSSLSLDKKTIIFKKYINIGVAVDVKNGLLVPVLKNVNKKSITSLSSELILLSNKAHNNKLNKLDMKDSCFTISNLGGIGGSWFTPIINSPEVAILGVSKAVIKPIWNGVEFAPSLILPLSLSYDHRVINGADAARFISFLNKLLSDIRLLMM
ncbi:2-oxo acid dehydrogenase subunit E2 [Buchnera aphidicola]|uniref:Dihydrolipoamide acetyltransferase component of pyruvate dehydrogenase complex n=1 Tax=Buchnera aphidicola (Aphis craccivora) TaxID=466616 RepID=A0AA95E499_9GAMM|nr:2-oxo acid dehydrogenase subunit E2 [Buchnera aphidicola]WAI17972.1 MAG: 2-oxo acid dehydrogenase subunit E2 [Buchnera aphidicola (Aphis craccivora)]